MPENVGRTIIWLRSVGAIHLEVARRGLGIPPVVEPRSLRRALDCFTAAGAVRGHANGVRHA